MNGARSCRTHAGQGKWGGGATKTRFACALVDRWRAASPPGRPRAAGRGATPTFAVFAPAQAQGLEIVERKVPVEEERQADHLLILRDGGVQRGALAGCVGDTCTIAGSSVPRERIAWIGLEADEDSPPGGQAHGIWS